MLSTEWNHIEGALAYALDRPLLVIHHIGVGRGVFDRGATSNFVYEFDLANSAWALKPEAIGAVRAWKERALALGPLDAYPEKEVTSQYIKAIGLEKQLAAEGYRFVWGDIRDLSVSVEIEGYERVVWADDAGKKWLLSARATGQVPLKTKKTPEDIHRMREDRNRG